MPRTNRTEKCHLKAFGGKENGRELCNYNREEETEKEVEEEGEEDDRKEKGEKKNILRAY